MQDLLHHLIRDAQLFLRDPLNQEKSVLATQEEWTVCVKADESISSEIPSSVSLHTQPIAPVSARKIEAPPQPTAPAKPSLRQDLREKRLETGPVRQATIPSPSVSIKETLSKIAPDLRLTDQVPDDTLGKKISTTWKERIVDAEVILLACDTDADSIAFLKTLAKAIDTHLAKTKILPAERLEKESTWDLFLSVNAFRLIVASSGFHQLKKAKSFYKEIPTQQAHFLDQTPFLPLLPVEVYKQLDQKARLWTTLCHILKT